MNNKLFVGNLAFSTTENDLRDAFAAFGTVMEVNLMLDRETGKSRGFAFVTMASAEEAEKAIQNLHGKNVGGRDLTVNVARPREERPGGGGGGYRGGGGGGGYRGGGGGGGGGGYRGDRGGSGDRRERGGDRY
ncbi:MAG: RNA-binding protein [Verrucomicrobia bacterium]|nr:RNA-binding protein [Verrucomicrobiota bacterium]